MADPGAAGLGEKGPRIARLTAQLSGCDGAEDSSRRLSSVFECAQLRSCSDHAPLIVVDLGQLRHPSLLELLGRELAFLVTLTAVRPAIVRRGCPELTNGAWSFRHRAVALRGELGTSIYEPVCEPQRIELLDSLSRPLQGLIFRPGQELCPFGIQFLDAFNG